MFLNFITQYGVFFGVLIGVILGLVVVYLIFSRPRAIEVEDDTEEKIDSVPFSGGEHIETKPIAPLKKVNEEHIEGILPDKEGKINKITKEVLPEDLVVEEDHTPEEIIVESSSEISVEEPLKEEEVDHEADEDDEVINVEEIENIKPKKEEVFITGDEDDLEDKKVIKKSTTKKPVPKSKTPPKKKTELGRYHVLFRKEDNMWYVKREGSDKIVKVLHTQKEAIAFATIKSITQKTSMVIHKRDGKIRKQTY
ncbi:DUF2188 domain-containing protein [Candidatus Izemoplasma sp. B36]|uniref:DUF2188 domain-containing protein n=1 Tax=Candidatus Izemoplasma sp. B36 TaxID=3242468 RepID=UPI0035593321